LVKCRRFPGVLCRDSLRQVRNLHKEPQKNWEKKTEGDNDSRANHIRLRAWVGSSSKQRRPV
jgi:hypothetical protein